MAAGPWWPTTTTREKTLKSQFDWDTDTFKCALFQSTSNLSPTSTTYAALTNEVAAGNGYTTGGNAVAFTLTGTRVVAVKFTTNPTWAASGGSIVARLAAIYEVSGDVAFLSMLDRTPTAVSDAVWGTPAGDDVTITSAGAGLPVLAAGTLFEVADHSVAANNGLYVATGSPTASSLPATKLTDSEPSSAASEAVTVYQGANSTTADGSVLQVDSDGTPAPVFTLA